MWWLNGRASFKSRGPGFKSQAVLVLRDPPVRDCCIDAITLDKKEPLILLFLFCYNKVMLKWIVLSRLVLTYTWTVDGDHLKIVILLICIYLRWLNMHLNGYQHKKDYWIGNFWSEFLNLFQTVKKTGALSQCKQFDTAPNHQRLSLTGKTRREVNFDQKQTSKTLRKSCDGLNVNRFKTLKCKKDWNIFYLVSGSLLVT